MNGLIHRNLFQPARHELAKFCCDVESRRDAVEKFQLLEVDLWMMVESLGKLYRKERKEFFFNQEPVTLDNIAKFVAKDIRWEASEAAILAVLETSPGTSKEKIRSLNEAPLVAVAGGDRIAVAYREPTSRTDLGKEVWFFGRDCTVGVVVSNTIGCSGARIKYQDSVNNFEITIGHTMLERKLPAWQHEKDSVRLLRQILK